MYYWYLNFPCEDCKEKKLENSVPDNYMSKIAQSYLQWLDPMESTKVIKNSSGSAAPATRRKYIDKRYKI